MSPELQTMLGNLGSIISEIQTMYSGEGDDASANVEMAEDDEENAEIDKATDEDEKTKSIVKSVLKAMKAENGEDDEAKKAEGEDDDEDEALKSIVKALENTPSDSSTASDDAETRIAGPNTEESEASLNEVAKALQRIVNKKKSVKKSAGAGISPELSQVLTNLGAVVQTVAKNQTQTKQAVEGLLKGLGVTQQLEALEKSEGAKAKTPVMNTGGNADLAKLLKDMMGSQSQGGTVQQSSAQAGGQQAAVRKNCLDLASSGLFKNLGPRGGRF